jgi:predicted nucleic acid-binding protein
MLKSGLEKAGTPLDDFDLILAACALANDLVLVTNNVKHDGAQRFIIRPNVQMVRASLKLS